MVNIEPVQDLHGYDYPWPAGGGKNVCPPLTGTTGNGLTSTVNSDGSITITGTATGTGGYITEGIGLFSRAFSAGDNLAFSVTTNLPDRLRAFLSHNGANVQTIDILAGGSSTATAVSGDVDGIRLYLFTTANTTYNFTIYPQVEHSATASAWSPYTNICPISGWTQVNVWVKPTYDTTLTPTATIPLGQTAYGGTLDVVRGKLVVDRAYKEFDGSNDELWYLYSTTGFYINVGDMASNNYGDGVCNIARRLRSSLAAYGVAFGINNKYVYFAQAQSTWGISTVADLRTWLANNPIQIVYELATPLEYDVTLQTIKTLLGTNNIWADAGSMEIEYVADTKLYIQRLTAPTEDDMIANENIAGGKFFMVGNDLYLSTAAIVAGETIVPGTNCTKLSLAEALNNINA